MRHEQRYKYGGPECKRGFGEPLEELGLPLEELVRRRLKAAWAEEYKGWTQRSLEGRQYAYWWVDGIYTTLRESDDLKLCLLVIIGVSAEPAHSVRHSDDDAGHRKPPSTASPLSGLKGVLRSPPELSTQIGSVAEALDKEAKIKRKPVIQRDCPFTRARPVEREFGIGECEGDVVVVVGDAPEVDAPLEDLVEQHEMRMPSVGGSTEIGDQHATGPEPTAGRCVEIATKERGRDAVRVEAVQQQDVGVVLVGGKIVGGVGPHDDEALVLGDAGAQAQSPSANRAGRASRRARRCTHGSAFKKLLRACP